MDSTKVLLDSTDPNGDSTDDEMQEMPSTAENLLSDRHNNRTDANNWELVDLLGTKRSRTDKSVEIGRAEMLPDGSLTDQHTTAPDISERDDNEDSEVTWKKYAKIILPHVGLVLLTCLYTIIGATIFRSIEQPNEQQTKRESLTNISRAKRQFLDEMWNLTRNSTVGAEDWKAEGNRRMDNITSTLFVAFEKHFLTDREVTDNQSVEIWSFSTSVFFAVTVVTTIGYGNPVPTTFAGRLLCIFFALFGIPLTLVTIADLGKFLSEHLIWLYGKYRNLKHSLHDRMAHLRSRFKVAKNRNEPAPDPHVCHHCRELEKKDLEALGLQEEKKIPATLVMAILIGYTALGGLILNRIETWTFFEAFYFSFVTMTTIGFGDIVPNKNGDILPILLYIVLGLAITTMCIDLVGVQYIRKIHYFGRRIQDARSAFAIIGGKAVYIGEFYANLLQRRHGLAKEDLAILSDAFVIENLYATRHLLPFVPGDIRRIRYIDEGTDSLPSSSTSLDTHSCRYCQCKNSSNRK